MRLSIRPAIALALVATAVAVLAPRALSAQATALRALDGDWIYLEDRTDGHTLDQLGPPMSSTFALRAEDGAVVLVSGHGSGHRNVRVVLDGSATDVPGTTAGTFARYRGGWRDGVFSYAVEFVRAPGGAPEGKIQREFRMTADGLIVRVHSGPEANPWSVGLYRHAEDIPMPAPARAVIGDLAWLVGAWTGTRGTNGATSIEERWSPSKGGTMLAVSRTVANGKMSAFEFLRIVERDGGLVYIAQPNGAAPTDFVLTELGPNRAVFDNPRHDYPKRIAYELSMDGRLTATIGYMKGGTPRRFEYTREGRLLLPH